MNLAANAEDQAANGALTLASCSRARRRLQPSGGTHRLCRTIGDRRPGRHLRTELMRNNSKLDAFSDAYQDAAAHCNHLRS
jgi:hypothetical protein